MITKNEIIGGALLLAILKSNDMGKYPLIWSVVLRGESKTFNDYNYYKLVNGKSVLYGKLNAKSTEPFSSRVLSSLTLGEVMAFQAQSRVQGQLWATGRFQVIPSTLKYMVNKLKLSKSSPYDQDTQTRIADGLIEQRSNLFNYLNGKLSDNETNLNKAILDLAKTWSSVGVPYAMMGAKKFIQKDESYYSGGGDKASVKSSEVAKVLQIQRKALGH
jgi:hypothetical protein